MTVIGIRMISLLCRLFHRLFHAIQGLFDELDFELFVSSRVPGQVVVLLSP